METTWVSMRRSYIYQGKHYGPGSVVQVPVGLQVACNLPTVAAPVVDEPLPTLANLASHLETLDLAGVRALQARDERKKAAALYVERIAALQEDNDKSATE